jgi:serine O-acetyltransferase
VVLKLHRVAYFCWRHRIPLLPRVIYIFNRIMFGVVLPPSVQIGRSVVLGYQGLGTVIHRRAVIGSGVNIGSGVTIGGRSEMQQVPVIEDDVLLGSGAKVLGPVRVGRGAKVGANAVVLRDVPAFGIAVGVPARIVRIDNTGESKQQAASTVADQGPSRFEN